MPLHWRVPASPHQSKSAVTPNAKLVSAGPAVNCYGVIAHELLPKNSANSLIRLRRDSHAFAVAGQFCSADVRAAFTRALKSDMTKYRRTQVRLEQRSQIS